MTQTKTASTRYLQIGSLIVNLTIVVMELIATPMIFGRMGAGALQYYTVDSNLFALLACALIAAMTAVSLFTGRDVPLWAKQIKYMATCCLTVTIVVVLLVLAPMGSMGSYHSLMLTGEMLYHHFLCPVLAILSFVLLEGKPILAMKHTRLAMIPTFAYAAVAIALNIVGVISGPYPFLRVMEQPVYMSVVWIVVILGGAFALAWGLRAANGALHGER